MFKYIVNNTNMSATSDLPFMAEFRFHYTDLRRRRDDEVTVHDGAAQRRRGRPGRGRARLPLAVRRGRRRLLVPVEKNKPVRFWGHFFAHVQDVQCCAISTNLRFFICFEMMYS